jgi:hypothetical protein
MGANESVSKLIMKLLDILSENDDPNFLPLSEKEIDKLKKMHLAFKSGKIEFPNVSVYTYELSDNYRPRKNKYGRIGLTYNLSEKPFGIQIYKIKDDKKISVFDKLWGDDIHAIFRNGSWDNASKHASEYNSVFERIKTIFLKFDINIWNSYYN